MIARFEGLRLSAGVLTAVRVPVGGVDRRTAGRAMALAPLIGAAVGSAAAAVGWAARWWSGSAPLAGVAAVAAFAVLTRGLHLDALADTADGLGSAKPADEALKIMKRSDIGPFGVMALVLTLAGQIVSLSAAYAHGRGAVAVIVSAVAGRLAITAGCTGPVPSARPDGLGAWVAGSVRSREAAAAAAAALTACGLLGWGVDVRTAWLAVAAVIAGVAAALILLRHCVRRFGGITGDVLGALVETATTASLVVFAFR